jgi:hypothetical protein
MRRLSATCWHAVTEAIEKKRTMVELSNTYQGLVTHHYFRASLQNPSPNLYACDIPEPQMLVIRASHVKQAAYRLPSSIQMLFQGMIISHVVVTHKTKTWTLLRPVFDTNA